MQNQENKLFNTGSTYRSVKVECDLTKRYNQYKIQEERNEEGCIDYKIIDNNDLSIVEVYNDKSEAEDALKFWNQ